jgi:hypothetical protein
VGWMLALLLGAGGLSACAGGSGPSSAVSPQANPPPTVVSSGLPQILPTGVPSVPVSTNLPQCKLPARLPTPGWLPEDLPMPPGTYFSERLPPAIGYSRGIFVVPGTLPDLARHVLSVWPRRGWILGRGDAEPGEVEDQFSKPPSVGAFKAQAQYCSPGYNLMLVIFVPDRSRISTTQPGTQPQSPLPGISPTGSPSG